MTSFKVSIFLSPAKNFYGKPRRTIYGNVKSQAFRRRRRLLDRKKTDRNKGPVPSKRLSIAN